MGKNGSHHAMLFMLLVWTMSVAMAQTGLSETLNRVGNYTGAMINADDDVDQVKYTVIFDAGSTGTRVHVFKFNANGNHELLPIGNPPKYEFNDKREPGLSSFSDIPAACVDTLKPLLTAAVALIEQGLRPTTPVWLGATGGLRLLPNESSEEILNTFAVNYLLGNLGNSYENTVAVIDLGGASVQMAYAISEEKAGRESRLGEDYIANWSIDGTNHALYTHSYLGYGLEAARAKLLKLSGGHGNPCVATGYDGIYTYAGVNYTAKAPDARNDIWNCLYFAMKVLNKTSTCPPHKGACSFDGIWNGGGGPGQKNIYVASSFYYSALAANIIDAAVDSATVRPKQYWDVARFVCRTHYQDLSRTYTRARARDLPFLCMNLIYEYTLLVHGFGIGHQREITVAKNMVYQGSKFEAAWPLGAAIPLLFKDRASLSLYRPSSQSASVVRPFTKSHVKDLAAYAD